MRSRTNHSVSSGEVHAWALEWLLQAKLLKDHGRLCSATVVWNVVLHAAARLTSICAACRDLANAPSDQAVFNALSAGLPKTLRVLERRLNDSLTGALPRRLRRGAWQVAIDWHLVPYYGSPHRKRNEVYYGKIRQGTKHFHAYATACIVDHGRRFTLVATWVRRHESTVVVLNRMLARIDELGLKIRRVLLDRAFFNVPVTEFLQQRKLPFLMPVVFRGRPPKKKRPLTGLRWIRSQPAGRYVHTLKNKGRQVAVGVYVSYHTCRRRKDGKRVKRKLLFAAWRVHGSPVDIREMYRKRFGIETSYRQMRQARIYTCTRDPHLRLVFVLVALILRNLWVWLHTTLLADRQGNKLTLHLGRLRFKQMLEWITRMILTQLHDGSLPSVQWSFP